MAGTLDELYSGGTRGGNPAELDDDLNASGGWRYTNGLGNAEMADG